MSSCPRPYGAPDGRDGALVRRARAGDTAAFEHLVHRYSGPVYRITLRVLGDAHTAQDAAQETFVIAWWRLRDIRTGQAFAAWLYRVATTSALRAVRARRPQTDLDAVPPPASPSGDPEQEALAGDLLEALRRALGRLTPEQRVCWVLRELEGLSYEEIAAATRCGPDTVRGRLHRARIRLAEELTPWR
jgi:RNA polymerase sigma-70 factor, ECF subfamily